MDFAKQQQEGSKQRLLIFIVAYNAESTIESVLRRIPSELASHYEVEILIIDDSSQDETFAKSELLKRSGVVPFAMTVLFNPVNQGYGGNQKIGFHYALQHGFDWVALVHGDGQYAPECLPELVGVLARGEADAVFGSRMMQGTSALKGGMPLYKFVGNKILTRFQNAFLGSRLSEFHSGYRLYATAALAQIPFDLNSNDFHFDTEIIIQLLRARLRIRELPIPTFYGDEICRVNGLKYAWDVCLATLQAKVQKYHIFYDRKYDCLPPETERLEQEREFDALSGMPFLRDITPGSSVVIMGREGGQLRKALETRGVIVKSEPVLCPKGNGEKAPKGEYLIILDDLKLSQDPEEYLLYLQGLCRYHPDISIIVAVGNIGFVATRMLLMFGRFSYTKRGIISFGHSRFFTLRSLKKLFSQYRFDCIGATGVPIHYSLLFKSSTVAAVLTALHRIAIRIRPSLFGYQLLCLFRPRPSLDFLLDHAIRMSHERRKEVV